MGYSREVYMTVAKQLEERRSRAVRLSDERHKSIYARSPEIAEIDAALAGTSAKLCAVAFGRSENAKEEIARLRKENLALQEKRASLLTALGYAKDYTAVAYTCPLCKDTGYTEKGMCGCMRRLLAEASLRASGLGTLASTQSFESFSLDYYADNRPYAEKALRDALAFAEDFEESHANLLFVGGTGLGKTHLSTAIARRVIERGFDVVYDIAPNVIADFEKERYKRFDDEEDHTERYFRTDLLIIDDLGTEADSPFALSAIYRLLNTRLNNGQSTIISTNLGQKNLAERYDARITSRLLGSFIPYVFKGVDVRRQKG